MKDHSAEVQKYIRGVQSGKIVAGKLVRYAVDRHVRDLKDGAKRGLEFSKRAANLAINFFPCIKHTEGQYKDQQFHLRMFQKFIVWCLFGWKRTSDGMRRFRYAFISLARGNGKSPFCAGLALLLFTMDNEARAQVYSFATKEAQAKIVFDEAKEQVGTSPVLDKLVKRLRANMHVLSTGSKFEPKGSDSKRSDGWNIHCGVIDELHAWSEHHRGLHEKIETAMGKRRQPMLLTITTAGDDQSELWQEQYDFYSAVVTPDSGITSDAHFAFIAEIDREETCRVCKGSGCEKCDGGVAQIDALEERYWAMANPMLQEPESPVKIDHLRTMAANARAFPVHRNKFLRYHANQLVASFYKLLPPELWATGNVPLTALDGRECFGGFDWGWRNDLAALALLFPLERNGRRCYELLAKAWIPEGCERDLTREPWASFIKGGFLTVTDGDTTDVDAIYATMEEAVSKYSVRQLAYDPNNAREFSTNCVNKWGIETYDFFQTCRRYNEPTRELVKACKDGRLIHGGNPLLAWCAGNLTVRQDSMEYIMPFKLKSKDKIDPLVATIMALGLAMTTESAKPSVYESRGLLEIG